MSILIRGMEMPLYCDTDCPGIRFRVCPIKELGEALMYRYEEIRHPDCPIVEVPPHGRLIDAEAFIKEECNSCDGACESIPCDCLNCAADCRCDFMKDIADAPTIIQAEPCNDLAKPNNASTIIEAESYSERELQRDYEASVEYAQYCERYEPTYDPETGAM